MSAPIWLTLAGDLGIVPEEEYYEFFFDAYNPGGGSLTYSVIAGSLPVGLELNSSGTIIGIPKGQVAGVPAAVSKVTTSTFTIRIANSEDLVADRTFSLTIAGIAPQIIIPQTSSLGSYLDGSYFYADINTIEPNQYLESTFSIIAGELPPGLSLNSTTGVISGYILPTPVLSSVESGVFDAEGVPFDSIPFNPSGLDITKNYQFTIKADNTINIETQTYTILVVAVSSITADNEVVTSGPSVFKADAVGIVTADILGPGHNPVILSDEGVLADLLQNSQVEVKIEALDFDGDDLTFEFVSGTLPPGISLNTTTGWLVGYLAYGTLGVSEFTFSVRCFKTSDPTYISESKQFTLNILGQIADILTWDTSSDLGTIYTGEISQLAISASTPSGRNLQYRLAESYGTLPYGLDLKLNGLITGRVSFETFIVDGNTTTFDDKETSFDRTYTFTVLASDINNYVYETKEFTIRVIDLDERPYENLYIKAFPTRSQRLLYNDIINNSDIFPESVLYRSGDPWFGKNTDRRSLFLAGLNPLQASGYIAAMTLNHYWKDLTFGPVKTARALDSNFNVKYEVVYVDLLDNGVNSQGQGPNLAVTLPTNSPAISTIYPNSFPNMQKRIEQGVGYENRATLPEWMTSRQADGTVIGFIRAFVLCYTVPGKSTEVAERLKIYQSENESYGIPISFTIDRYEWDTSLSNVLNKNANAYVGNNFVSGTGLIVANTASNIILGLTSNVLGTGNVSGTFGTTTILGNNTSFNTELSIGKPLYRNVDNAFIGTISSIISAEKLILRETLTSTINNVEFKFTQSQTAFTEELHVNDTILVANNILGTVKTITSDSNIILYTNAISNVNSASFTYTVRDSVSVPGVGDKYLKYPQVGVIS